MMIAAAFRLVFIFVVAPEPFVIAFLITAKRRPVEPLVHSPQSIQSTFVRRVGVIYDAIFKYKTAHTRRFAGIGWPVRTYCRRELRTCFRSFLFRLYIVST